MTGASGSVQPHLGVHGWKVSLMHLARKLPTTVGQDQLLGYCLALPQKDGRWVDEQGNPLPNTWARGMVLHTWTLAGWVFIEDRQ